MSNKTENNKKIAKNTLFLYFRMLFMMCVSLYTSRIILNGLGVEDYGIYNVVGGVVTMFTMLSGTLNSAISRFITYELGKGDEEKIKNVFSTAINIQIILIIIIAFLGETIGLWFLNNIMIIPENRIDAANWVFQLSLLTFMFNLISIPYNASIIAHEKMSAFAYISILEVIGKLLVAYAIRVSPIDNLVFYSASIATISIFVRFVYSNYCKRHFPECKYTFVWDKPLLRKMFGFAGWNMIGASSVVLRDHGTNILINLFFGPNINAAKAIANRVNSAIQGFVNNFLLALNPQIIKNYASGNYEYMYKLTFNGARLSFYILLLLSLPVLINTHYILYLWLGHVPEHTVMFVQLVLLLTMNESLGVPLSYIMVATGNIKNYQIIVGGLQCLTVPVSYLLLKLGFIPETIFIVAIILSIIVAVVRVLMLNKMVGLPVFRYFKEVYLNAFVVSLLALIIPFLYGKCTDEGFMTFLISTALCLFNVLTIAYFIGCKREERNMIKNKILSFYYRNSYEHKI